MEVTMVEHIIANEPNIFWDAEQENLAREYYERLQQAFADMPNSGRLYYAHAAAVLRQVADEMDPVP